MDRPPTETLPNVRQYYMRVLRQTWSDYRAPARGQVMSGVIGVLAALISREVGWIPKGSVVWTVSIAVLPYAAFLLFTLIFHAIRAPVKLDNRADDELAEAGARAKALEDELSAKHPHDEHLEAQIVRTLQVLDANERRLIAWLLDSGEATRAMVQHQGFRGINELNLHAGIHLVKEKPERNALGNEVECYYEINPLYLLALKNALHPPTRAPLKQRM